MRPHPRRTRTDPQRPRAWGTSDRSGFVGQHAEMRWQYEWAGNQLVNTHKLVHQDELDKPNRQLGSMVLPPDPVPTPDARPENYTIDEVGPVSTTLTVAGKAGDSTLTVADTSKFATGNYAVVQLDNGGLPRVTVTVNSATVLAIAPKLTASAAVGNLISVVAN